MSYMSTGIGPSPFLSTSRHHFHSHQNISSTHPHYNTNSYTNSSSYVISFSNPQIQQEPKYFRSDMRNIFPKISKLETQQQQKLLNPLNTYSGNVFSTTKIASPFDRGEIYYGNKYPKVSQTSQISTSSIIDQLETSAYGNKKQNPFNKKYLLTQKNKQLENYAFYSSLNFNYQTSQTMAPRRKKTRNTKKSSSQKIEKIERLNEQDMTEQVLKMATKYDRIQQKTQQKNKHQYNSSGNLNVYNQQTFQPLPKDQYNSQRQQQYLVESQVDQKQFDSFGQGKQYSRENIKVKQVEKNQKVNPGDSLIIGLAKMAAVQNKQEEYKQQQSKSRRQPVFIDSEDDQRKSGTFKVPQAIIDEINNPRIPSTIFKKQKQTPSAFSIQRSLQISQRGERKKQEGIQVNRNPPKMIMLRGKTYQKLSI